ncbi:response regulator [Leptolyngbya sp. NIES-2104]|uniref:response regulator n=1 Tax=Leptolyngbya sp. NIES-2104 TaxID=1552121 RepID=UPI0006ECAA82|nr:response regulator [Leptolyngbya sp. NIES-2104]GAP94536.1 lead, cadmium, zinc and mercury transporting ATPase / copper-translocating P-type ATPase [Leptolyngbya sp. NIES-2104]
MLVDDSSTDSPSGLLGIRSRMHFSGRLDVFTSGQHWSLYLYMGRLIWATGGPHPRRRWHRYLTQHCPQLNPGAIALPATDTPCHDYHALAVLVKRQQISPEQAVAVIRSTVVDVLFDIIQQEETRPVTFKSDADDLLEASLALLNAEQLLSEVQQQWNTWRSLGLADHSPNLAPVLRHPEQLQEHAPEKVYKMLVSLVDGRRTLRDLAMLMKQDLLQLTRVLVPLYRKGLVALTKIPDLTPLGVRSEEVPTSGSARSSVPNSGTTRFGIVSSSPIAGSNNAPLIACIDDSVRECQIMERIVTEAGYQFIGIQDSIQALPTLLEKKPGLIFLDLVMPIANGYEICAQIRRVSVFKNTPIVILTSNDGIIDRVRAKFVGSSGFLAKPVDADRVLAVARKVLPIHD